MYLVVFVDFALNCKRGDLTNRGHFFCFSFRQFVTLDDIMNLVGSDELHSEEQMRTMWKDSMRSVNCIQAHISYEQFLLLMKGQMAPGAPGAPPQQPITPRVIANATPLLVVPEGVQVDSPEIKVDEVKKPLPSLGAHFMGDEFLEKKDGDDVSLHSLPNIGGAGGMHGSSGSDMGLGSPATSPATGKLVTEVIATESTKMPTETPSPTMFRSRSKSLAHEDDYPDEGSIEFTFKDPRRTESVRASNDALAVKRTLYQAHRQMRLAVLDASRRFEEEQARRARDTLIAQNEEADARSALAPKAGLVMKHGRREQVTSETIRQYLEKYLAEQQQLVEKANRRGGRGRSTRKKTISDMSAMLNPSMGQDELGVIAILAQTPDVQKTIFGDSSLRHIHVPDLSMPPTKPKARPDEAPSKDEPSPIPSLEVIDKTLRKATVPGDFRKTKDPFSASGMYGGARMSNVDVHTMVTPNKQKS
jgi:hypothetical protein